MNVDYVYEVDHMVRPGETLSSLSRNVYAGGKGLNQSIAMARAGAQVYHAGAVGREDGTVLLTTLQKNGVNTDHILVYEEEASGHAIITVDRDGQNSIILHGGCNQRITPEQIDEVLSHFSKGDFLLLQNEISNIPLIIEKASEIGMTIVLNPSPSDAKIRDMDLHKVDYLILNEIESADISGEREEEKVLPALLAMYPEMKIVLTRGKDGSVYKDKDREVFQPSYRVAAVDTTGAGDTFTGYFFAGIHAGESVEQALETASKAAAISVTISGAEASIPYRKDVEAYRF